ncbi:MAG: hypothetical protein H6553_10720 [Chitinophagales bacterium]|nr:hypothetical protein [Chitinophagales bacterium]
MIKNILAVLFVCYSIAVFSCDFCSCASNALASDFLNQQNKSFVAATWQYRKLDFKNSEQMKYSTINALVLQGAYAPKSWLALRVNLPLLLLNNVDATQVSNKSFNVGDMQLLSNFTVIDKQAKDSIFKKHQLNFGVGIELPTGKQIQNDYELLQNFSFGSKSVDFLFNQSYSFRIKNWIINESVNLKINTYNKEKYKYGNTYIVSLMSAYLKDFNKCSIKPFVALSSDFNDKNLHNSFIQNNSGYYMLSTILGLETLIKQWSFAFSYQQPMYQITTANNIQQKQIFNINLKYNIK